MNQVDEQKFDCPESKTMSQVDVGNHWWEFMLRGGGKRSAYEKPILNNKD